MLTCAAEAGQSYVANGESKDNIVTNDSEESEVSEEVPAAKPRISIVIILAMLLGVLLTVGVAGAFVLLQQSRALGKEVLTAKADLKEKSIALEEMKTQIEALSRQMNALKEFSIARSGNAKDKSRLTENNAPSVDAAVMASPSSDAKEVAVVVVPEVSAPPKVKKDKPKPDGQSCELVGKSPEEQAATLKRCVSVMDTPQEKQEKARTKK